MGDRTQPSRTVPQPSRTIPGHLEVDRPNRPGAWKAPGGTVHRAPAGTDENNRAGRLARDGCPTTLHTTRGGPSLAYHAPDPDRPGRTRCGLVVPPQWPTLVDDHIHIMCPPVVQVLEDPRACPTCALSLRFTP